MVLPLTKAVIPAAGLGTRFLPATKVLPKEMLPVVDKPAIQYVVEEAVNAGFIDILMVTGRNKNALEDHFDRAFELEATLEKKGDESQLNKVTYSTDLAEIHYVRQGDPLGLGHAVSKAAMHVGREPFALLLGDDIIDEEFDLLSQMIREYTERGATIVALMEVPDELLSSYGVASIEATDKEGVVRVTGLVEKPVAGEQPSNYAIIGRYILQPEIFDVLAETKPGRGGEIQLTDALAVLAQDPSIAGGVYGIVFSGRRYDTGDRLSYLKAVVQIASHRKDLGEDFSAWLVEYVASLSAAQPAQGK
ncbi:MAG: UTP--glucose-1-phosphate uridylyltransferase GalU [Actinomycetales bacterium]|nr:UTP--glucose-1-phosphate uridylyltransferase GalU [Actinomycetales bacterium]